MKRDSGSRPGFSQMFDSGAGSEGKAQDPAGVDSGSVATSDAEDPSYTLKSGLLFSIFQ